MNVVVGGGWAGLAAAVELAHRGMPVTLIEAADRLGGRARRVLYRGREADNGQHLLIGAYHHVLYLLQIMGIVEDAVFERRPFELHLMSAHRPAIRLRLPALPAPLHLLCGLLTAAGLGAGDKRRVLRFCLHLRSAEPGPDDSVQALLARTGQSPELIARLWEPLCLATLNTPLHQASAEIFTRVLRDAFLYRRRDSDLLIARADLGAVLPDPARAFIEARAGRIIMGQRVLALETAAARITGIVLADGARLAAEQLILALPPSACLRLIAPFEAMRDTAARLARIDTAPICTAYLQYAPDTRLPFPLTGLHGATAQWVCDLAAMGRPGLMSVVVSGPGHHMAMENAALLAKITGDLAGFFPHWPAPLEGFVLREKRATLLSCVGVNSLRIAGAMPLANCHIAGDAAATGYPSTLEGAVSSGIACARRIPL